MNDSQLLPQILERRSEIPRVLQAMKSVGDQLDVLSAEIESAGPNPHYQLRCLGKLHGAVVDLREVTTQILNLCQWLLLGHVEALGGPEAIGKLPPLRSAAPPQQRQPAPQPRAAGPRKVGSSGPMMASSPSTMAVMADGPIIEAGKANIVINSSGTQVIPAGGGPAVTLPAGAQVDLTKLGQQVPELIQTEDAIVDPNLSPELLTALQNRQG
jgi:hypothetical protein